MKSMEVSARAPKLDKEASIVVNYPETLEEAKQAYGEEAILTNAFSNWKVVLQAGVRRMLEAGKSQEEIQAAMADAKMGVAIIGGKIDPIAASLAKFKTMSVEEQAAFLEQLKAAAAGAAVTPAPTPESRRNRPQQ